MKYIPITLYLRTHTYTRTHTCIHRLKVHMLLKRYWLTSSECYTLSSICISYTAKVMHAQYKQVRVEKGLFKLPNDRDI